MGVFWMRGWVEKLRGEVVSCGVGSAGDMGEHGGAGLWNAHGGVREVVDGGVLDERLGGEASGRGGELWCGVVGGKPGVGG